MSSISALSGSGGSYYASLLQSQRRQSSGSDTTDLADELFSQLDTSGQGYISQSDLESSLSQINGTSGSSSDTSAADALFAKLDSNGDGKVTKDEFASGLQALADQLDQAFQNSRTQQGGDMPPPPPPSDSSADSSGDQGLTESEMASQLSQIGSSDSQLSSLMSTVLQNFSAADTNGDGKVTLQEALAYQQSQASASSSSSTSVASASASSSSTSDNSSSGLSSDDAKLLQQIMRLLQAYGMNADSTASQSASSSVSVTA